MMMIFHFHVLRFSLDSHLINRGPVKTESCTSILYLSLSPSRLPLTTDPKIRPYGEALKKMGIFHRSPY